MDEKALIPMGFAFFGLCLFIYPNPLMQFWNLQFGKNKDENVVRPLLVRTVGLVIIMINLSFIL